MMTPYISVRNVYIVKVIEEHWHETDSARFWHPLCDDYGKGNLTLSCILLIGFILRWFGASFCYRIVTYVSSARSV